MRKTTGGSHQVCRKMFFTAVLRIRKLCLHLLEHCTAGSLVRITLKISWSQEDSYFFNQILLSSDDPNFRETCVNISGIQDNYFHDFKQKELNRMFFPAAASFALLYSFQTYIGHFFWGGKGSLNRTLSCALPPLSLSMYPVTPLMSVFRVVVPKGRDNRC